MVGPKIMGILGKKILILKREADLLVNLLQLLTEKVLAAGPDQMTVPSANPVLSGECMLCDYLLMRSTIGG
jgi:hypothetical protein